MLPFQPQTSDSARTNKASGGIGLRPESTQTGPAVRPLPRGEGWPARRSAFDEGGGEGEFDFA
jgi:hypothetical protein